MEITIKSGLDNIIICGKTMKYNNYINPLTIKITIMTCKILIVVISCQQHRHLWKEILNRGLDNIIIICGKTMKHNYSLEDNILYLNCNDGYEGLPEKIIYTINAILKIPKFQKYTHIMKIDDHDTKFNNSLNYKLENEPTINLKNPFNNYMHDYLGQRLHTRILRDWHINKCTPLSYWNTRYYTGMSTPYLDGGSSYILSRRALICVSYEYKFSDIETIRENHIWEDLMIALILKKYHIYPKKIPHLIIGDK